MQSAKNSNETGHHHHHHQSLYREGRWGTTDDFATSFLHFSLFSTALWDLANSRPVHSLMLSSHLFLCRPCLLPPFTVPCKFLLSATLLISSDERLLVMHAEWSRSEHASSARITQATRCKSAVVNVWSGDPKWWLPGDAYSSPCVIYLT